MLLNWLFASINSYLAGLTWDYPAKPRPVPETPPNPSLATEKFRFETDKSKPISKLRDFLSNNNLWTLITCFSSATVGTIEMQWRYKSNTSVGTIEMQWRYKSNTGVINWDTIATQGQYNCDTSVIAWYIHLWYSYLTIPTQFWNNSDTTPIIWGTIAKQSH